MGASKLSVSIITDLMENFIIDKYVPTKVYHFKEQVLYNGLRYISNCNNNLGNIPSKSAKWLSLPV